MCWEWERGFGGLVVVWGTLLGPEETGLVVGAWFSRPVWEGAWLVRVGMGWWFFFSGEGSCSVRAGVLPVGGEGRSHPVDEEEVFSWGRFPRPSGEGGGGVSSWFGWEESGACARGIMPVGWFGRLVWLCGVGLVSSGVWSRHGLPAIPPGALWGVRGLVVGVVVGPVCCL